MSICLELSFVQKKEIGTRERSEEKSRIRMKYTTQIKMQLIKQCALKIVNNCLNTNIYSNLEASGGKSFFLYLNVVHFFNTRVN